MCRPTISIARQTSATSRWCFFGVYSGETDHNYGTAPVAEWFAKIVVEIDGAVRVIDNPRRAVSKQRERPNERNDTPAASGDRV